MNITSNVPAGIAIEVSDFLEMVMDAAAQHDSGNFVGVVEAGDGEAEFDGAARCDGRHCQDRCYAASSIFGVEKFTDGAGLGERDDDLHWAVAGMCTYVQKWWRHFSRREVLLMPDGVYVTGADGTPSFVRAPQLTDDEVQRIVETTAKRVVRLLQRRGVLEEGNVDPLWQDEPLLATITAVSVQGQIATGERAGLRVRRRLIDPEEGIRSGPLCFASRGFSLHAATRVEATDRVRLEKLCRYVIRPPLDAGRLQILDADPVAFSLKSIGSDGTYQIVLSPENCWRSWRPWCRRRGSIWVRYHGGLAPNATDRAQIVPGPKPADEATDTGGSDGIDWPGTYCWRQCSNLT